VSIKQLRDLARTVLPIIEAVIGLLRYVLDYLDYRDH
jgi:hypothetical protein